MLVTAVSENWIVMGLAAAAAWALSSVIDVCFVGDGVYREPSDGPVIAGLFCLLPLATAMPSAGVPSVETGVAGVAMLAGVAYLLHIYLYFRALFTLNDAANAEIFNTLSVLIVPVLAWVLLGERLAGSCYLAIGLGAVGVLALVGLQAARMGRRIIALLAASVCCVSLSMVLQAWVLRHAGYGEAVWWFSLAGVLGAVAFIGTGIGRWRRIGRLWRRFGLLFLLAQALEIGGVLASQRATDVGPSVSLVALLECTLPVFVMGFSLLIAAGTRQWQRTRTEAMRAALARQTRAAPAKFASLILILCAVLLVRP